MDYLESYLTRLNHRGSNHQQREYYYGIKDFEKYLSQHPSAVDVTVDQVETRASIISNSQDEFELTKKILTSVDTEIQPGSIVIWGDQHWIVYQRVRQPNETYTSCYMTRCNNKIVWLDDYGIKHLQYCYVVSAEDSKIKANFRTWNGMITPQPNQYLQILIPTNEFINLGQKFIINERAWFIVEYDKISAPGIMYCSLTQDKVDRLDDDVESGIVDYSKQNKAYIDMQDITIGIGTTVILNPILYNDGYIEQTQYVYEYTDGCFTISDNNITGVSTGSAELTISLKSNPDLKKTITVTVQSSSIASYQLEGAASIRISQTITYIAYVIDSEKTIDPIVSYTLSNNLVTAKIVDGKLLITANEANNIGEVTVTVNTATKTYTKELTVKSLW